MFSTFNKGKRRLIVCMLAVAAVILFMGSCNKLNDLWERGKPGSPGSTSSEVVDKWILFQLRLMKNATGIPNHGFSRHFAYSGIAAWESIAPGVPGNVQRNASWNGLSGLPSATGASQFYWPASVNAALATMNRLMFPNATAADKAAIDSLEQALRDDFLTKASSAKVGKAADFGKAVATAVYAWSETDGYKNANRPYTPPVGDGKWEPTPPSSGAAATPYWGENRPVVKGSLTNTHPGMPPAYSTDPQSAFYQMVKQVHDASQALTQDQKDMAIFWRDIPGVSSPGHWLSILHQTLQLKKVSMAKAALAYALSGAATNDALIGCFQVKYQVNLLRPITYIRNVIGQGDWNAHITTPAHPEFPSAHSALSGGAATVMESLFPDVQGFVDHTYDYQGMGARSYSSYTGIAVEAGVSRLYGGIHFQPSIEAGLQQGKKIGQNILRNCIPSNSNIE